MSGLLAASLPLQLFSLRHHHHLLLLLLHQLLVHRCILLLAPRASVRHLPIMVGLFSKCVLKRPHSLVDDILRDGLVGSEELGPVEEDTPARLQSSTSTLNLARDYIIVGEAKAYESGRRIATVSPADRMRRDALDLDPIDGLLQTEVNYALKGFTGWWIHSIRVTIRAVDRREKAQGINVNAFNRS